MDAGWWNANADLPLQLATATPFPPPAARRQFAIFAVSEAALELD